MFIYAACHKLITALSKRLFSDHQQPVSDLRTFEEFFKSYENPSLEGFGDSDEVGTDEIKEDLEMIKRASAFRAFCASRKVEDTNPNYNSSDDAVSVCEDGESLYTYTFTPSGFFAGKRLRKRVEHDDDVNDAELSSEPSVSNSEQVGSSQFTNAFDDSGYFVGRRLRRVVADHNEDDDDVVESTSAGSSAVDDDDVVESSSVGKSEQVRRHKLKRKACCTVTDYPCRKKITSSRHLS